MNRFVKGGKLWQRHGEWITFGAKVRIEDGAPLVTIKRRFEPTRETLDEMVDAIYGQIRPARAGKKSTSDKEMGLLLRLPGFVIRAALGLLHFADRFGAVPRGMIDSDPLYTSCFVANLGSVGHEAGFHHLWEHGTCSLFGVMGKIKRGADGRRLHDRVLDLRRAHRGRALLLHHDRRHQGPHRAPGAAGALGARAGAPLVAEPAKRDLYQILGVARDASEDVIRKAYRKLARRHHPDVNPNDKGAEDKFKEISHAYSVLSDAEKRRTYDEFGEVSLEGGFDPEAARRAREAFGARFGGGGRPSGFGDARGLRLRGTRRPLLESVRAPGRGAGAGEGGAPTSRPSSSSISWTPRAASSSA